MNEYLQYGALGLLALVLVIFLRPLLNILESIRDNLAKLNEAEGRQNELLRDLVQDVYNGRCRYGAPSAGTYRAVKLPSKPDIG